jgi:hypothetical protein
MRSLPASVVLGAVLAGACGKASSPALPVGLALELAFDGTCDPRSAAPMTFVAPTQGLRFVPGVEGRAASFDGSGASVAIKGLDRLGLAEAFTLEFLVNAEDWENPYGAGSGLESLVSHSGAFSVAIDPHQWRLQARLEAGANEHELFSEAGSLQPGVWHHVALRFDGELGQLALDGRIVATEPAQGQVTIGENLALTIGTWFQRNQAFCGSLDSLRLWTRALGEQELAARAAALPARSAATGAN